MSEEQNAPVSWLMVHFSHIHEEFHQVHVALSSGYVQSGPAVVVSHLEISSLEVHPKTKHFHLKKGLRCASVTSKRIERSLTQ